MATTTTLGFSILSRYSGHGVAQARRDLATLRTQIAAFNKDIDKHTQIAGGIPTRWKAIGGAMAAVAPALIPLSASLLQTSAAATALAAGVGSAMAAYGFAMKGAITQTMALAKAGKALTPVQKEFVSSVNGMKSAWQNFVKQTSGQTLSTATNVVQGLTAGIKLLKPLVDAIHPSLLQVSKDFEKWMKGDQAKEYSRILSDIAKTSMPSLVSAGKSVMNVLGDGFRAFAPLADDLAKKIANGAASLQKWSDGGGFQRFMEYVKTNAPAVKQFWDNFRDAIANVFNILKEFSGGSLSILTDALRAIAAINPENVKAFAMAMTLLKSPIAFLVLNCPPLRDAIIAFLGALNPATIYAVVGAFTAMRIAFMLMNASLISTPLGWIIVGLAALAVGIVYLATKTQFFQTIWEGLKVAWSAVINALKVAWDAFAGAMVSAWNATWNGLKTAAEAVWNALKTAWNAVVSGLSTAWSAVSGALVTAWNTVWNGLKTAAEAVWNALKTAWNAVVSGLSTAWSTVSGALVTAWNTVWNGLKVAAETVWNALKTGWSAVVGALSTAWSAVSGALVTAWNTVWNGLKTAAEAVWNALKTGWSAFTSALSTAWTTVSSALTTAWNAVWNALKTAAQAVWTAMQTAWSAFINTLSTVWNTVSSALKTAWQAVWTALQTAATTVWNALKTAWQAVLTAIQTAWTTVSNALKTAWQAVWTALQTAATTVWNALKVAWQAFLTAVQTIWTTVSNALKAAWQAVWTAIKTAAETVWNALKVAWQALGTALTTIWNTVSAALKSAWQAVWNFVKTTAESIWNGIKTAWNAVGDAINSIWNKAGDALKKAWSSVWNTLKDTATSIWGTIKSAVEKGINGLLSPINALINGFNKISSAVGLDIKIPNISVNFAAGGMVGEMPHFAAGGTVNFSRGGGVLNGYAPGRDTVPAMLSKGEGVLVPEAVRGLGGAKFVHWANSHYSNGRGGKRVTYPGYGKKKSEGMGFAVGGVAMGAQKAYHRVGGDSGWSFQGGGIFVPPPQPSGGLPGLGGVNGNATAPNSKDINKKKDDGGGIGDFLKDAASGVAGVLTGGLIGDGGGTAGMVLGFLGKEALEKAINPLIDAIAPHFGPLGEIMGGAAKKIGKGLLNWLIKKDEDAKKTFEAQAVAGAKSVSAWADLARKAMIMGGLDPAQLPAFLQRMAIESGGNPNAINNWDINAKNGIPSQGLMQIIPPNFTKYHVPGTSNNILDPLANMAAAAAYIKAVYGGRVPTGKAYALGTPGAASGPALVGEQGPELVNFRGGETVTPAKQTSSILSGMGTAPAMPAASDIAGMVSSALNSGGTSDEIVAKIQEIIAAAQKMSQEVTTAWTGVTSSGQKAQATLNPVLSQLAAQYGSSIPQALSTMGASNASTWATMGAQTNAQWVAMQAGTFTPAKAEMTTGVPLALTTMGAANTATWTAMNAQAAAQWLAMQAGVFIPANTEMTTTTPASLSAMSTATTTHWTAMKGSVDTNWAGMRDGAFLEANDHMSVKMPAWGNSMNTAVSQAWTNMGSATSTAWEGMKEGTRGPTNWIIQNSYNDGIARLWNEVAKVIFEDGAKTLPTVATLAKGGPVRGPGGERSDRVPAMLSRGEHVWTAREVHRAGGHHAVQAMRQGVMGRKVRGGIDGDGHMPAFALGGWLGGVGNVSGGLSLPGLSDLKRGSLMDQAEPFLDALDTGVKGALGGSAYRKMGGSAGALSPSDWMRQYIKKDDELNKIGSGGPPWVPGVSDKITSYGGVTVNQRTADMLDMAKQLGASFSMTQGSFSTGVSASAGTHDGGGVVDVSPTGDGNVGALRAVGFAAWNRGAAYGSPSFSPHIHAVALGDPTVSPAAASQIQSYLAGGNGLADGGPDNFSGGIPSTAGVGAAGGGRNVDPKDLEQGVVSFDSGGLLQPGYTLAYNGTRRPEPVGHNLEPKGLHHGDVKFEINIHGNADAQEVVDGINTQVLPKLRQYLNKGTGTN